MDPGEHLTSICPSAAACQPARRILAAAVLNAYRHDAYRLVRQVNALALAVVEVEEVAPFGSRAAWIVGNDRCCVIALLVITSQKKLFISRPADDATKGEERVAQAGLGCKLLPAGPRCALIVSLPV